MTITVYALLDPDDESVRYVGKTSQLPRTRLRAHMNRSVGQKHIPSAAWIVGLLAAGKEPKLAILEVVPEGACWKETEKRWVAHYRSVGANLLNATCGGGGTEGWSPPLEVREKLSAAAKAQFSDPARRAAASGYAKAQWQDEAFRKAKSAHARATGRDPEFKRRQREVKLSLWQDEAFRARVLEGHKAADHSGGALRMWARPEYRAKRMAALTPEARAAIGARSKAAWAKRKEVTSE